MENISRRAGPQRIAIVGGGISGLAAAWRLLEIAPHTRVNLLEASNRVGGVLRTIHEDGFLIERSADSFITDQPWAVDFCRRLGLEDALIGTEPAERRAMVVRDGKLYPVPRGFQLMAPARIGSILTTPVLSLAGKLRLACERFVPQRSKNEAEESLAQFATRRLGREVYQRLVQPLVAGIYSADPEKLSVLATLPRFVEMEATFGSLTRAARARTGRDLASSSGSGARYGLFVAPRDGVSMLVESIARQLPADVVQLGAKVEQLARKADGSWTLKVDGRAEELSADGVVLATPSSAAATLLADVDSQLSRDLASIPYSSCAIVVLGYKSDQIRRPLHGFGFVVPAIEGRRIIAASYSSSKFANRAPADHVLIRVFIGGALQAELVDLPDEQLRAIACEELGELLGIRDEPLKCHIVRWRNSMPQYHVGHGRLVDRIQRQVEQLGGLALAGNAYRGVGIPQCIRAGELAAEKLLGAGEAAQ